MEDLEDDYAFDSWEGLTGFLLRTDWTGWIFRGHASLGWSLESKLSRSLKLIPPSARKDREDYAVGHFKRRAHLYLDRLPAEDDAIGWLSLTQHYGAPTRLLDWTESPFQNWLLRWAIREEVDLPVPLLPLDPDRRMASQQAVFTVDSTFSATPFPLREDRRFVVEGEDRVSKIFRTYGYTNSIACSMATTSA